MDTVKIYDMADGRHQFLPFELPEGRRGKLRIRHEVKKKGEKEIVVSLRNAIFMGLKPASYVLDQDVIIHKLEEGDHGTWMTSHLQEVEQHERQLARFSGHVLVGGLGLGLAAALLQEKDAVQSITVVEKSKEVIKLVKPYLRWCDKLAVFNEDLFDWLKQKRHYDYAFFDIWCPTGERIIRQFTLPLRQAALGAIYQHCIEQWNEDEMVGQGSAESEEPHPLREDRVGQKATRKATARLAEARSGSSLLAPGLEK